MRQASHQKGAAPTRDPPGTVHAFRCVWPMRWQRLHCSGPFGSTYVSTVTRRPQSQVRESTLETSGLRATDTMTWG